MTHHRKYICPACKQKTGVDILYGLVEPGMLESIDGDVALGGCCFPIDGPERSCTSCGNEWRIRRRKTDPNA